MTELPTQFGKYAFFRLDGSGADLFYLESESLWRNSEGRYFDPVVENYKFWFHLPTEYLLDFERHEIAESERPWYPKSWLDSECNPVPDVYEVPEGEFPPCKPHDWIEPLTRDERHMRREPVHQATADSVDWGFCASPHTVVAIRIIWRRVKA